MARFDHITGLLAYAVADGHIVTGEAELRKIQASWWTELQACVLLEALIVRTARTLDIAGVDFRLTKGAAVAHLDYPDPSMRTFGDVDLVIHPSHWEGALEALTAEGCRRQSAPLPGHYDQRYGKGATLTTPEGLELDLHRRLAIGRFGIKSKMTDLFESTETIDLAGRQIPVLTPEHRLLHACYHATLGGFRRLRAFRDVAQLVLVTEADVTETYAIARRWKAEAVVTEAIRETWRRLDLDPTHPTYQSASERRISSGDARALKVFAEHQPFRRQALTAMGRLGPIQAPRYLWVLMSHRLRAARSAETPR